MIKKVPSFLDLRAEDKKQHTHTEWGCNIKRREILHCAICQKDFKPKVRYQIHCSNECKQKDESKILEISERLLWKQCQFCGLQFRKKEENSCQKSCDTCKRQIARDEYKKINEIDRWVKAKKRKGLPLEELIRRMEWKRVWDDAGWERYLSGKKRDLI